MKRKLRGLPKGPNEFPNFISTQGYKRNSPDRNKPINVIPSGNITMKDVDFPVRGVDNLGNEIVMMPGREYTFPGDYVVETPYQKGGESNATYNSNWLNKYQRAGQTSLTYPKKTLSTIDIVSDGSGTQYPYYSNLTDEEKRFFSSNTPIGRAVRAKAQTGKVGQTHNDLSRAAKTNRVKQNSQFLTFKEQTNKRQTGGQINWLENFK